MEEREVANYLDAGGINVCSSIFDDEVNLDKCVTQIPLNFTNCTFRATLSLNYASIRLLLVDQSKLDKGFCATGLSTNGPVIFDEVIAESHVSFTGAHIRGNLMLSRTCIKAPEVALDLSQASVSGIVHLSPNLRVEGEIELIGTKIEGDLSLREAKITAPSGTISAKRLYVGGDLVVDFSELTGPAWFNNATIGGDCSFNGVRLSLGSEDIAIGVRWTEIKGALSFSENFKTDGSISLEHTKICKDVIFYRCALDSLIATNLVVSGEMIWRAVTMNPLNGLLMLEGADLGSFRDDSYSWPANGFLRVRRARLGKLVLHADIDDLRTDAVNLFAPEIPLSADSRLRWLRKQDNESALDATCWFDLARLLKSKGDMTGSRQVLHSYRKHQAFSELALGWPEHLSLLPQAGHWLFWTSQWLKVTNICMRWLLKRIFAAFEREPLLIIGNLLVLTLLGTGVFYPLRARFSPTDQAAYQDAFGVRQSNGSLPPYPKFSPFIYALENSVPLIKLGQDDKWAPNPRLNSPYTYLGLLTMRWSLILAGWTQASILLGVLGERFLKKV